MVGGADWDRTSAASAFWIHQDKIGLEGLDLACSWICKIFGLKIWVRSLAIEARDSFSERDFTIPLAQTSPSLLFSSWWNPRSRAHN